MASTCDQRLSQLWRNETLAEAAAAPAPAPAAALPGGSNGGAANAVALAALDGGVAVVNLETGECLTLCGQVSSLPACCAAVWGCMNLREVQMVCRRVSCQTACLPEGDALLWRRQHLMLLACLQVLDANSSECTSEPADYYAVITQTCQLSDSSQLWRWQATFSGNVVMYNIGFQQVTTANIGAGPVFSLWCMHSWCSSSLAQQHVAAASGIAGIEPLS